MTSPRTPQRRVVPPCKRRAKTAALLALAALVAAACRDAPTDPMVGVVAEESAGALALDISFADPENMVGTGETLDAGALQLLERWRGSWQMDSAEGHAVRAQLYPQLDDVLSSMVRAGDIERELASFGDALRRAREIPSAGLPSRLGDGIDSASARYDAAVAAAGRGDARGAVSLIVQGGDALREVGPEAVARSIEGEVETAYGRFSPSDSYTTQDLERLRRLVHGSRQAVEQGDWVLAIRRAYYAKALLDANGG